ncbi:hypothetical protein NLM27_02525 [Bradyrhizobium sp. CCGB12]|uniref:hypothetical protein n=1 Tax=Bradyrhizobium sp. CCGB12 TaxID=2949632 RepID=UPI0020B3027A|nr:hypothetical protein [Bradyrhizobium sp. CCGB12]MCP3387657.1 hypothetical protein [Bradyrhizobium sp. CCGB12]
MRKNEAEEGVSVRSAGRCLIENPFIVAAHGDGENDFPSHYIRNSISLTMQCLRRMICASHQRGE